MLSMSRNFPAVLNVAGAVDTGTNASPAENAANLYLPATEGWGQAIVIGLFFLALFTWGWYSESRSPNK